jgi:hypothetical protein
MAVDAPFWQRPDLDRVPVLPAPPPLFDPAPWLTLVCSRGIFLLLYLGQHPSHEGQ